MNHKLAIFYGIGVWVFPFVVAMLAFPLRTPERALFESIMAVSLVLAVSVAALFYLKQTTGRYFMAGFCLGLLWLLISLALDSLFFSWGPMKMSFMDYVKDIGVAYLIIFIIPTTFGYLLDQKLS